MRRTCHKCSKSIAGQIVTCVECERSFHPGCAATHITSKSANICCKGNLSGMPIMPRDGPSSQLSNMSSSVPFTASIGPTTSFNTQSAVTLDAIMDLLKKNNDSLQSFMDRQNKSNEEMCAKLNAIENIVAVVEEHSVRITNLETENEAMSQRIAGLEADNVSLAKEVSMLRTSAVEVPVFNTAEISMSGIPTEIDDDPLGIVSKVLRVLGVPQLITDVLDVRQVTRKPPQRPSQPVSQQLGQGVPRIQYSTKSLIVCFKSSQISSHIINKKRIKGPITASEAFSTQQPGNIYINEILHPDIYNLLRKTKDCATRRGWKYVWTRQGRIYARKLDGAPVTRIACEADLVRLD